MIGVIIAAIIGGTIYRLRGMGLWPSRPWYQIAFALPYGIVAGSFCGLGVGFFVFAVTTGCVLTGHASYIDLGSVKSGSANMPADGKRDEWYGIWIPGGGYWHDFGGLMVSGLLISAPAGITVAFINPALGVAVAFSGILKAPAYAIAWVVYDRLQVNAIMTGEILTGGLLWGALALAVAS